jgi:hypothetical protein
MAHLLSSITVVEARFADVDEVIGKVVEAEDVLFSMMIVTCFDDEADLAMHGEIVRETGYLTVYPIDCLNDYLNDYLIACLTAYLTGCLIVSEIEMGTETAHLSLPTVY